MIKAMEMPLVLLLFCFSWTVFSLKQLKRFFCLFSVVGGSVNFVNLNNSLDTHRLFYDLECVDLCIGCNGWQCQAPGQNLAPRKNPLLPKLTEKYYNCYLKSLIVCSRKLLQCCALLAFVAFTLPSEF